MRLDEGVDALEAVDPGGVLEIGPVWILMTLAEAHQGLVRPGIIVKHGNLDDPRLDHRLRFLRCGIQPLQLGEEIVGLDLVGIELDLIGRVCRADLGDALDLRVAHRIGDEEALEKGLERHRFADLGEDVLVAAEGKSGLHD